MKSDISNNPNQNGEYALVEYLERLGQRRQDRIALVCHLSRLQPYNRRSHHIRIAHNTFENLLGQYEGKIFSLRNSDVIFIGHSSARERLNEAMIKMRYLFSSDPLMMTAHDEGMGGFGTWYQLDRNYDTFLEQAKRWYQSTQTGQPKNFGERATDAERLPINPDQLGWLEDTLSRADLTNLIRNQPICALSQNKAVPVFNELYVSIADLETQIVPGVDLSANRWLFQYLTSVLDRRMLVYLANERENSSRAFSFNLNVATLLSSDFAKFDKSVSVGLRGRLVIELQMVDVFSDMAAFMFARDYVMDRGYRICLDGLTHSTVPFIDRAQLGFSLIKMQWNPAIKNLNFERMSDHLMDKNDEDPLSKIILCRCDNEEAVETGKRLGINLYQGRHIDKLVRESEPHTLTRPRT